MFAMKSFINFFCLNSVFRAAYYFVMLVIKVIICNVTLQSYSLCPQVVYIILPESDWNDVSSFGRLPGNDYGWYKIQWN